MPPTANPRSARRALMATWRASSPEAGRRCTGHPRDVQRRRERAAAGNKPSTDGKLPGGQQGDGNEPGGAAFETLAVSALKAKRPMRRDELGRNVPPWPDEHCRLGHSRGLHPTHDGAAAAATPTPDASQRRSETTSPGLSKELSQAFSPSTGKSSSATRCASSRWGYPEKMKVSRPRLAYSRIRAAICSGSPTSGGARAAAPGQRPPRGSARLRAVPGRRSEERS